MDTHIRQCMGIKQANIKSQGLSLGLQLFTFGFKFFQEQSQDNGQLDGIKNAKRNECRIHEYLLDSKTEIPDDGDQSGAGQDQERIIQKGTQPAEKRTTEKT